VISARNSARDSNSNLVTPKGNNQLGGDLVRVTPIHLRSARVVTRPITADRSDSKRVPCTGPVAKPHTTVAQKVADVVNELGARESTESPRRTHRGGHRPLSLTIFKSLGGFSYRRVRVRAGTQLDANRPGTQTDRVPIADQPQL
jgi:hypothetical protein